MSSALDPLSVKSPFSVSRHTACPAALSSLQRQKHHIKKTLQTTTFCFHKNNLLVLTPETSGKESSSSLFSLSSRNVIPVQFMATINLLFCKGGPGKTTEQNALDQISWQVLEVKLAEKLMLCLFGYISEDLSPQTLFGWPSLQTLKSPLL